MGARFPRLNVSTVLGPTVALLYGKGQLRLGPHATKLAKGNFTFTCTFVALAVLTEYCTVTVKQVPVQTVLGTNDWVIPSTGVCAERLPADNNPAVSKTIIYFMLFIITFFTGKYYFGQPTFLYV
jgi:hypothetical protein